MFMLFCGVDLRSRGIFLDISSHQSEEISPSISLNHPAAIYKPLAYFLKSLINLLTLLDVCDDLWCH